MERKYINRELSWLEFNQRVLDEAKNKENPLFERLKFASIVSSNLDEFFMVRVASLKDMVNVGFSKEDPSGLTPKKQLKFISQRVHRMTKEQYETINDELFKDLKEEGYLILSIKDLNKSSLSYLKKIFETTIYPVLTPMAVDSGRPFPLILNKSLNIAVFLKDTDEIIKNKFATVQVPSMLPRLIEIPDSNEEKRTFVPIEEVIIEFIGTLFWGKEVVCAYPYRITRNADLGIEEDEAEDLLIEIEKSLKKRKWGQAIRLEVDIKMAKHMTNYLRDSLEIHKGEIYYIDGLIDFTFSFDFFSSLDNDNLKYKKFSPKIPKDLLGENDIFEAIKKKDIFFHHPYESFEPIVEFIKKSAEDPSVLAIKQTLYRVSGDSPIVKALEAAAEKGKQVTVLVELKARFDEENNIIWAKRLEKAGCHVIYGLVGLKTHSKITLIVRKEYNGIRRYIHLGTGNYNDITARFYTDMGILTCDENIGSDASTSFNMLSGYSEASELRKLILAPRKLRGRFIDLIKRETENASKGKKALIKAKMNSLVDPEIIKYLYEASCAGVKIELIVRGICCLRAGVENLSENIKVISIVGRYLEHSRIYYFLNDGEDDIYLSSADMMTRNLNRRVEIMFPIMDREIKERIKNILEITLKDNVKAKILMEDDTYVKYDENKEERLNSQEYFMKEATEIEKNFEVEENRSMFEALGINNIKIK